MRNVMETSLKQPIQNGEFRKNPVEPAWVCPAGYEYEIIEREDFRMEYLQPVGVYTGRMVLQLHGGGYIGPMKNIYRRFAVRYSKLSYGGDVLSIDYRVAPGEPLSGGVRGCGFGLSLADGGEALPAVSDHSGRGFGGRRTGAGALHVFKGPFDSAARRCHCHVALGGFDGQRRELHD